MSTNIYIEKIKANLIKGAQAKKINMPEKLYKYKSFSDKTVEALRKNRIYLNYPNNFNDPYDCSILLEEFDLSEFDPKLPEKIDYANEYDRKTKELTYKIRDEIRQETETLQHELHLFIENLSPKLKEKYKVTCFARTNLSILMWSHYANYHKGFCVEYMTNKVNDFFADVFPVMYTDVDVYWANYGLYLLTKHIGWKYEDEWRYYTNNINIEYIDNAVPSAVYLGTKMPVSHKNIIKKISKDRFPVHEMKMRTDKFELYI